MPRLPRAERRWLNAGRPSSARGRLRPSCIALNTLPLRRASKALPSSAVPMEEMVRHHPCVAAQRVTRALLHGGCGCPRVRCLRYKASSSLKLSGSRAQERRGSGRRPDGGGRWGGEQQPHTYIRDCPRKMVETKAHDEDRRAKPSMTVTLRVRRTRHTNVARAQNPVLQHPRRKLRLKSQSSGEVAAAKQEWGH